MSNEEKPDSTTESTEAKEAETQETTAAEPKAAEAKEAAMKVLSNVIDTLKQLQKDNPKVFYGGLGVVAVILLFMMMGGGGSGKPAIESKSVANLQVGKQYVLRSPNTYEQDSTVRLVSTPGNLAAYDDTEKADREGCKHLKQGTKVIVKDFYGAYGNPKAFAKVSPVSGECQGAIGWTSSINIQDR